MQDKREKHEIPHNEIDFNSLPYEEGYTYVMDNKKDKNGEDFNFKDLAHKERDLQQLKKDQLNYQQPKWMDKVDKAFENAEKREKHIVNRKKYIILCLLTGFIGGHRYYERRYKLALLYTVFFFTMIPFISTLFDLMAVIPMKPDEKGNILI